MEAHGSAGQGGSQGCDRVEARNGIKQHEARTGQVEAGDGTGNSHLLSEPCLEALGLWTFKK